jgi:hypothetical protein
MLTDQQLVDALLIRCPHMTALQDWIAAVMVPIYLRRTPTAGTDELAHKRERKALKREAKWGLKNKMRSAKAEFYRKNQEALAREMAANPEAFKIINPLDKKLP